MKAIVMTAPQQLELREQPMPEPGPGQVRVRTAACGICATDLEMIGGDDRVTYPTILGHEWSGWIDAVGPGGDEGLIGQQCVAENVLSDGGEVGFEHPGGCGEYLITEASRLQILDPQLPPELATLIEPIAVCVRGLRRLRANRKLPTLIFGDGPIGLICLMLLRHMGAKAVDMVGGRHVRMELAKDLGARKTWSWPDLGAAPVQALREHVADKYPLMIEASGNPEALNAAIELAPRQGRILLLGGYNHRKTPCQWGLVQTREIELVGSNASADAWSEATQLAVRRALPLERLVTHRIGAANYHEALRRIRQDESVVKTVLMW